LRKLKHTPLQGTILNAIAIKLSDDGELTPRGLTTWTATTIRNILERGNI
jgi:hypothetical protein